MALALSDVRTRSVGNMKCITGKIGFDSSYAATPGEALTMATLGLTEMFYFHAHDVGGYSFLHNYSTTAGKLAAFAGAGFTPAGTISKPTFTVTKGAILGSSELGLSADAATATVNNNTIAATLELTPNGPVGVPTFTGTAVGAAAQVDASGADLSSLTTRFIAFGV